jgi:integrase
MHVRLKGLNCYRHRLKDGSRVEYWYAWKGGPRLQGKPGSPEFIASYNAAVATKIAPPAGVLLSIIQGFRVSDEYLSLAARTRQDYDRQLLLIERKFGDLPLKALEDRRVRGILKDWRTELAKSSRRQADYAWDVLRRVINVAIDRGLVSTNPCSRAGRLYKGSRADLVWTEEQEAAFKASAPAHLHLALMLGLWTGQRQGDLLRLTWADYDGMKIRLKQSKTGKRVTITVGEPLKRLLDATPRVSPTILVNTDGRPWTPDGFSSSWRKASKRAGISGVTFNDLRGTAVTRLALCGATEAEIATVTGHALSEIRSILDKHYFHRDPRLAENAIRKLERGTKGATKSPNTLPNGSGCSGEGTRNV